MNIHSLIPLLATIAYIPLLIILYSNRPWQRQKWIFALFLLSMMAWSFGDVLFRSDFFLNEKLYIAKGVMCIFFFAVTQLHYFLLSNYESKEPGFRMAYVFMGIGFLIAIFFLPESVTVGDSVVPVYGFWIYPVALYFYALLLRDLYMLWRKLKTIVDPIVHNQIVYLILGVTISIIFATLAFSKIGQDTPLPHVGNFINALILTYAVIRHRLLDMRIVLRRSLIVLTMAAVGIGVYLLIYVIGHYLFMIEVAPSEFILGIIVALVVTFVIYQIRDFASSQIDKIVYGGSYEIRQELNDFVQSRIKGVLSLDELGKELLTLLSGAIKCKQAFLLLPQEATNDFYIHFAVPPHGREQAMVIQNDSPIIFYLQGENTYLARDKIDIAPEFKGLWWEERENIKRLNIQLFLPFVSRGKIIGLLALGEKAERHRFTLEDINLLEKIIGRVATSLEKEYLQDQLMKREKELAMINSLAGVISSSLNIQDVYDAFVSELKEIVETDYTAISIIEENDIYMAAISTEVGSAWQAGQRIPLAGSAIEWVNINRKPFYDRDISLGKRFWTTEEHFKRNIRSILHLPLINKGSVVGVLTLGSRKPYAYSPEQITLLEHLASQIAAPIENSKLYTQTEQIARVDGVTELFNRRHFDERLKEEIDRHARYGDALSLLLLDLDNFKKYNDTYGHLAGDKVITLAASQIKSAIRSSDLAFRYGGDEFAVILPNSTTMEAFNVAERVRERVSADMSSKQIDVTISIGVASWPGDGATLDELCSAADTALYYAKRTGQNRTSIASKTLFSLSEPSVNANAEAEVLSTIYALAATLEARDKYTYGHSRRVSRFSVAAAEALNLRPEQVATISAAALLHDIGKIGIPDSVLNKNGKLLDEEWELLRAHPRLSATIIGHVPSLNACLAAVRHHHERLYGKGYPAGLKEEEIPVEARILAVTDAFEAMISNRPYRGPLSYKKAIAELETCSGSQFDARIVNVFIPIALASAPDEAELEIQKMLPSD